jgi:hypothetical protein
MQLYISSLCLSSMNKIRNLRHALTYLSSNVDQLIDFPMSIENVNVLVECRALGQTCRENKTNNKQQFVSYLTPLSNNGETRRNNVSIEVQCILMCNFPTEREDRSRSNVVELEQLRRT